MHIYNELNALDTHLQANFDLLIEDLLPEQL